MLQVLAKGGWTLVRNDQDWSQYKVCWMNEISKQCGPGVWGTTAPAWGPGPAFYPASVISVLDVASHAVVHAIMYGREATALVQEYVLGMPDKAEGVALLRGWLKQLEGKVSDPVASKDLPEVLERVILEVLADGYSQDLATIERYVAVKATVAVMRESGFPASRDTVLSALTNLVDKRILVLDSSEPIRVWRLKVWSRRDGPSVPAPSSLDCGAEQTSVSTYAGGHTPTQADFNRSVAAHLLALADLVCDIKGMPLEDYERKLAAMQARVDQYEAEAIEARKQNRDRVVLGHLGVTGDGD